MIASGTFSSPRNVRSTTAPPDTFLSLVRTNAPPLPGLTCWNSTTVTRPSDGRFRAMPFLKSLDEMLNEQSSGESDDQVLGEGRERLGAVRGDDHRVLDAHAAHTGEIHAGLDRDDRTGFQGITGTRGHSGLLVDLETHPVAGAVHERIGPSRGRDHLSARAVDGRAVGSGAHRLTSGPLAVAHDVPHAPGLRTGVADAHGARHVGAVAVDDATEVDDDEL